MATQSIEELEREIYDLTQQLMERRKAAKPIPITKDYRFDTTNGQVTLLELFGDATELLLIHNMGQGCRYCTLWADGFNGFLPHLESTMAVALVSKDPPDVQRQFANSRNWRFRMASHGGGAYITEQTVMAEGKNTPGAVLYSRDGDTIYRNNACVFGPGDIYCSMWSLLGLAGKSSEDWTPQYNYWHRPKELDDGGQNVLG